MSKITFLSSKVKNLEAEISDLERKLEQSYSEREVVED